MMCIFKGTVHPEIKLIIKGEEDFISSGGRRGVSVFEWTAPLKRNILWGQEQKHKVCASIPHSLFFLISFSKVSDVLVYKITYQNRICVLVRVLGPGGDRSTAVVALLPKNGEKREKKKMEAFRDDYWTTTLPWWRHITGTRWSLDELDLLIQTLTLSEFWPSRDWDHWDHWSTEHFHDVKTVMGMIVHRRTERGNVKCYFWCGGPGKSWSVIFGATQSFCAVNC